MKSRKIKGPIFISIGEEDQLAIFLEKNPDLPKELLLTDDYSFAAYNAVGLGRIGEDQNMAVKGTKNMKAPNLSMQKWLAYASSVGKLAPIPKDLKFGQIPEGVTRLGATYAIDGKKIVFTHEDGVPGDHPVLADVLAAF